MIDSGASVSIIIKAVDDYSKTLDDAKKSFKEFGSSAGDAFSEISKFARSGFIIAGALSAIGAKSAENADIAENYNKVLGEQAERVLPELQRATLGTVEKYHLMAAANSLVMRGVKTDALPLFAKYSMQLKDAGIATGNVTSIMEELSAAMLSGRDVSLKRLGITIDQQAAEQAFADKLGITVAELSEAGRKAAIYDAAIIQMQENTKKLAEPTSDLGDKLAIVKNSFLDLLDSFGKTGVVSGIVSGFLNILTKGLFWAKKGIIELDFIVRSIAVRLRYMFDEEKRNQELSALSHEWTAKNAELQQEEVSLYSASNALKTEGVDLSSLQTQINQNNLDVYLKQNDALNAQLGYFKAINNLGSRALYSKKGLKNSDGSDYVDLEAGVYSEGVNDRALARLGITPRKSSSSSGTTVNINGNIQGLNSDAVADSIQRKLQTAIR